jgi:hypothetical protein
MLPVIGPKNKANPLLVSALVDQYTTKKDDLLDQWFKFKFDNRVSRDTMLEAMHRLGVRPDIWIRERDAKTGVYPNISDPEFAARLTQKTEFAMLASDAPSDTVCTNTCVETPEGKRVPGAVSKTSDDVFDTTPVQRLVARFLHPTTPYRGLLLNHGVGVGKTCSAVTVAEMFLEYLPNRTVFILAPQAIAEGFRKTIFDVSKLVPTTREEFALSGERWKSPQCTGMTYLRLTNMEAEPNRDVIDTAVRKMINSRYKIMGYLAFAKMMQNKFNEAPKSIQEDKSRFDEYKNNKIISMFNDHLLIVDEAHNLRDEKESADMKILDIEDPSAVSDAEAGKQLTPILKQIVVTAEGLRLMLMTATPMYNKATEILFLLRLLLANDANDASVFDNQLRVENVFNLKKRGRKSKAAETAETSETEETEESNEEESVESLESNEESVESNNEESLESNEDEKNNEKIGDVSNIDDFGGALTEQGKEELIRAIKRYVSYMRGENPNTFPLRLTPDSAVGIYEPDFLSKEKYPQYSISRKEGEIQLNSVEVKITQALPLVISHIDQDTEVGSLMYNTIKGYYNHDSPDRVQKGGAKGETTILYKSTQIGNITYDAERGVYGNAGWYTCFRPRTETFGSTQVTQYEWNITGKSIDSVFRTNLHSHSPKIARIVESVKDCKGLSFIFSQYVGGGALPIAAALEMNGWCRVLHDGTPAPLLTTTKPGKDTKFYILLTSSKGLAPEFSKLLRYATQLDCNNANGPFLKDGVRRVQAIIGSQITSEGLDLKCIRQLHVLDGWYHLNRIEQIIGRGVRFCSHSLLPVEERNCTVYLHALDIPKYETADLYAYRLAVKKARYVGEVARLMKMYAWDCMLNMNAILLPGQGEKTIVDSVGKSINIEVKDKNYSGLCDYAECPTKDDWCPIPDLSEEKLNASTFRDFDFRRQFAEKQKLLAILFAGENIAHPISFIREAIYKDIPWSIGAIGLREALNNLRIKRNDGIYGTLVLKNGYVLFQPDHVTEIQTIPAALRYGRAFGHLTRVFKPDQGLLVAAVPPPLPIEPIAPAPAPALPSATPETAAEPEKMDKTIPEVGVDETDISTMFTKTMSDIGKWIELVQELMTKHKGTVRKPVRPMPEKGFNALRWVISWMSQLDIPGIKDDVLQIATMWFIDNFVSNDELIALMKTLLIKREERISTTHDEDFVLNLLKKDITQPAAMIPGFMIYNTKAKSVQSYCYLDSAHGISTCDSSAAKILANSFPIVLRGEPKKQIGRKKKVEEVELEDADVSNFFGILVQISNDLTFKLVYRLKGGSATGTVCKTPSGLATHRDRLRKLYSQIPKSSPMHSHLFKDLSESKQDKDVDRERTAIQTGLDAMYKSETAPDVVITDISHLIVVQVCIYTDFLLRWLDMKNTDNKRWFLRLTETVRSGIPME